MINQELTIRPFEADDQASAEHILTLLWGADTVTAGYYRFGPASTEGAPRFGRTLVAEQDGVVVGFASLWTNPVHPQSLYVGVQIHPAWQMRGIGTQLYAALMEIREAYTAYPLQTATWENCPQALRFLKQRGFQESKRTYEPILDLTTVDLQRYQLYATDCRAAGYKIANLAELASMPDHADKLVALVVGVYHTTHSDNIPMPADSPAWKRIVLESDLLHDGSFVVHKAGDYVAFGFLHPHEDPSMLSFGWHGVAQPHWPHAQQLVLALALHEMKYAHQHGYTAIQAEVDTTDPCKMILLSEISGSRSRAWITLRTSPAS